MDEKNANLTKLQQAIVSQRVGADLAAQARQLVFGEGSPDAEVVFVGEAPGKKEDETGRPFVGAAGRLLDELLVSISLDRSAVYITNIVKYRPPNNRDPLPEEKQAFLPFLWQQIAIINPKVVVTLGRHSMRCFRPELKIGQAHGTPQQLAWDKSVSTDDRSILTLLPLYHPAAALYNGGLRQTLFADMQQLATMLGGDEEAQDRNVKKSIEITIGNSKEK